MHKISQKINRFFFRNRNKGIPNLMIWITAINAAVLLLCEVDPSGALYLLLRFDRDAILRGEVWRLFSYIFLEMYGIHILFVFFFAFFYCQLQRAIESLWGTLKFNAFYLTSIIFLDIYGMFFGYVSPGILNSILFLTYATLFPDAQFRILFIIPIKARWLGIINLIYYLFILFSFELFPMNLSPLLVLASYFLFLGKDFLGIFPDTWRINVSRLFRGKKRKRAPIQFTSSFATDNNTAKAPYIHRCTVCGRTDVSDPQLEFRYCSKCSGYRCYCIDHINSHAHIE